MSLAVIAVDQTTEGDSKMTTVTPAAHLTDASVAHALNATFSDTEAEAALNALGAKINSIIDALEAAGIMATA